MTDCYWCGAHDAPNVMYRGTSWHNQHAHDGHVLGYECERCADWRVTAPYDFAVNGPSALLKGAKP